MRRLSESRNSMIRPSSDICGKFGFRIADFGFGDRCYSTVGFQIRKPFMEWIAAFIQSGPEETVRALSGVDELVIALFLKDVVHVYEVDRDDPPEGTQMIFTPDNRFGVEPIEEGEPTTIAMLILDA